LIGCGGMGVVWDRDRDRVDAAPSGVEPFNPDGGGLRTILFCLGPLEGVEGVDVSPEGASEESNEVSRREEDGRGRKARRADLG
jgi:hypothetical protein